MAKRQRGFTLIEIIVVIALIALLAAYVAPNLLSRADDAKRKSASIQIEKISTALELYKLEVGQYPASLNALRVKPASGADRWKGPYVKKAAMLEDPWGRPLQYRYPGATAAYELYSFGTDGQQGGTGEAADISAWE